jgi:hypothetical protein
MIHSSAEGFVITHGFMSLKFSGAHRFAESRAEFKSVSSQPPFTNTNAWSYDDAATCIAVQSYTIIILRIIFAVATRYPKLSS